MEVGGKMIIRVQFIVSSSVSFSFFSHLSKNYFPGYSGKYTPQIIYFLKNFEIEKYLLLKFREFPIPYILKNLVFYILHKSKYLRRNFSYRKICFSAQYFNWDSGKQPSF